MWKVGGIRIEHKQARSFFLRTDNEISEKQNFFTLWPVTRKGREILGWAIKGQMMDMYRGPSETHSVIARCMGKTCGIAAVLAATAATAAGPRGRNPISESTVKQSEK